MKVIFDIETTGLNPEKDEILQFSAIDENGEVLLDTYIHPMKHKAWPQAMAIHGITPEMVEEAPGFDEVRATIQELMDGAEELIAYNGEFDMNFLKQNGIIINEEIPYYDVMIEFAEIYGEWNDYYHEFKWQKLTTAAHYYGFEFGAHNSLEDVRATLFTYFAIKAEAPRYEWHRYLVIDDGENTVYEANNVTEMAEKAREIYGPLWNSHVIRATKNGLDLLAYKDAKPKTANKDETWRIRLLYDGIYKTLLIQAKNQEEAERKLEEKINVAKEYEILGVQRLKDTIKVL